MKRIDVNNTWLRSRWRPVAVAVIGLLLLFVLYVQRTVDDSDSALVSVLVPVVEGPLVITVNAAGTLKAKDQASIVNTLEGRTTILSLVAEGTQVKKGDRLIELDASNLQDKLIDQQIVVQNSEAAFVRARENQAVVENQGQSDVDQAQLALQLAEDDLKKYRQGEFPNEQKGLLADIAVNEEELQRAEEKLAWSQVLFDEKFLSQSELQADALAAKKARIDLDLSRSKLTLALDFTHKRTLIELNAKVKNTRMALERARRKAVADNVQAEAELKAKAAGLEREKSKLEKIQREITKTVIVAPQDGMVVYETSRQASWRGAVEPLAAGQEVRERQELIYLPASGPMLVECKIHESALQKVRVGQTAKVFVDAMPGRHFDAEVVSIAVLPDATSAWMNPNLKLYRTELALVQTFDELRTGMNCRAEILVAEFDRTLSVPLQSVVVNKGQAMVYPAGGERRGQPQPVEVGLSSMSRVQVLSGVRAGDRVLLNPPLSQAD